MPQNKKYSIPEDNHRISTENPQIRDAQFSKLREFLLSRDYNSSIVDSAIVLAKAIPREVALKKVEKKEKPD